MHFLKKLLSLIVFFPLLSFGQIKLEGRIIDAKTKQIIAFANIENYRIQKGAQSNQDGVFSLTLSNGNSSDTLKISCIGYEDYFITGLKSDANVTYELNPIVFQLKEVSVGRGKAREIEIGVLNKSGHKWEVMNQRLQNPGLQNAVYMQNTGYESAYIEKLHFFMGDDMFDAPFRIHLYENENGVPGKSLFEQALTYSAVKKKSWNVFNVSEHSIRVPKEGFWVSVEWIANEAYKKSVDYMITMLDGKKQKSTYTYYGPEIMAYFDSDFGLTYYKFLASKKWLKRTGASSIGLSKRMRPVNIDLLVRSTIRIYD